MIKSIRKLIVGDVILSQGYSESNPLMLSDMRWIGSELYPLLIISLVKKTTKYRNMSSMIIELEVLEISMLCADGKIKQEQFLRERDMVFNVL